MPIEVEVFEDDQIVVVNQLHPFDPETDVLATRSVVAEYMPKFRGKLNLIINLSQVEIVFASGVAALANSSQMGQGAFNTPGLRTVFVSKSEKVRNLSASLKQRQYGHADVNAFESVGDALAFLRTKAQ